MLGSVTRQNVCQPLGAQHRRRFLLLGALRLHQRDQLARDERKGDEHRRQHDARHGEDDLEVVLAQPRPEPALQAEDQHVDQARDHRRHRERQVDQRDQQVLAAEAELGDRPGRGHAEDEVQRHRDRRGQQRQPDRVQRIRLGDRREIDAEPLLQRLVEHERQRHEQEQREERQRDADQQRSARTRGSPIAASRAADGTAAVDAACAIAFRPARPAGAASTPAAR